MPSVEELRAVLQRDEVTQLWLISLGQEVLTDGHFALIEKFWNEGRGVYIWGDNTPLYVDANKLSKRLVGITTSGNKCGSGQVLPLTVNGPGMRQHETTTGIERLYEGHTVASLDPCPAHFQQIIFGSENNLITAAYEKDNKRLIMDGAFTRLYVSWDDAGSARYVV